MAETDITSTVLVTGPTRGLGLQTCRALVRADPSVGLVLLGRPGPALDAVVGEVTTPERFVVAVPVDFASLAEVATAAGVVTQRLAECGVSALAGVVLNAGLQTGDRLHRSVDGLELTFAVNLVAQHLLVRELMPVLSPATSVAFVGSGTHTVERSERLVAHPRWEDPELLAQAGVGHDAAEPVAGQRAYATSKLAVNHLCHELVRRHDDGARFNVYDPGMMPGTGLARDLSGFRRFMWERVMPHLRLPGSSTPQRSARVLADLVLGRSFVDLRGGYIDIDRVSTASADSFDAEREQRLWDVCEALIAESTGGPVASNRPIPER